MVMVEAELRALLMDDEGSVRRSVARNLRAAAALDVKEAGSSRDAIRIVVAEPLDILFLDVRLSSRTDDREGISFLFTVRDMGYTTSAVMLTCLDDFTTVRAAFGAGAYAYVLKYELTFEVIRTLTAQLSGLRGSLAATTSLTVGCTCCSRLRLPFTERLARRVKMWAEKYRLTAAEADILSKGALDDNRDTIALARGSSPLTVKTQFASLLRKTGDDSFHATVLRLLREMLDAE